MECPKCKNEISDEKPICSKCGFDVNSWDIFYPDLPKPTGYINDWANLLAEEEKQNIEKKLREFFEKTENVIVVVTKENTKPLKPSQFAFQLFNEWGIGGEKNKGVLIVLALKERRIESEVGYGLENILTDEKSGEILDEKVVPYLKEERWAEGLNQGIDAIINILQT